MMNGPTSDWPVSRPLRARDGRAAQRAGVTLVEAVVGIVVLLVIVAIAIPLIFRGMSAMRKNTCAYNLRNLGGAIDSYQNRHAGQLPTGSRYHLSPPSPWGVSWWVDVLPDLEASAKWDLRVPCPGDFSSDPVLPAPPVEPAPVADNPADGAAPVESPPPPAPAPLPQANPNVKLAAGLAPRQMFCPASELSLFNDPEKHLTRLNRELLGANVAGIAVPHYAAIAGSAPDMFGAAPNQPLSGPRGRNTQDGPLGILSASGAFPPNQRLNIAALRDGQGHVMLVAEQSGVGIEDFYDRPLRHELRSSWSRGGYAGAGAAYGQLNPMAEGVNGTGEANCFNITSIRYGINAVRVDVEHPQAGRIAERIDAYPPPTKEQPAKRAVAQPPGPGHNQGIFSAHEGGANVLFADGRVDFLSDDLEVYVLQMLATRDDGNVNKPRGAR